MARRLVNTTQFGARLMQQLATYKSGRHLLIVAGISMVGMEYMSYWWGMNSEVRPYSFHAPSYQKRYDSLESSGLTPEQQQRRTKLCEKVVTSFSLDEEKIKSEGFMDDFLHENVVFNDHVVEIEGRKSVETLMFGLPKMTMDAGVNNVEIEHYDGCSMIKCDGLFRISQRTAWVFPTVLYVEFDGSGNRVTRIEDHWYGRPFLFYGFTRAMRKVTGHLTLLNCRLALGLAPYIESDYSIKNYRRFPQSSSERK